MTNRKKTAVFVATNFDYLHNLQTFLLSRDATQNDNFDVFVEVVNVPASFCDVFKSQFKNIHFIVTNKIFKDLDSERGYMTNRRVVGLNMLADEGYGIIGYCDVNTILVKDISNIIEPNKDVFIAIDEQHKYLNGAPFYSVPLGPLSTPFYGICLAGVQFYKNTDATRLFLSHYQQIMKDKMLSWFADQEALFLTYKAFSNKITVKNIKENIALKTVDHQSVFICEKKGTHDLFRAHRQNLLLSDASSIPSEVIDQGSQKGTSQSRSRLVTYRLIEKIKRNSSKVVELMNPIARKLKSLYYRIYFMFLRYVLLQSTWKFQLKYFPLYLDLKNKGISVTLASQKEREVDMTTIIREELKVGETCFDLGSNIGFYPMLDSTCVGPNGKIICVEPDPRNIPTLEKNLSLLENKDMAVMLNIAISSTSEKKYLQQTEQTNLNVLYDQPLDNGNHTVVECLTVDDLAEKTGVEPDFIRMDIEGHEVSALAGMKKLIASQKSMKIFFELHPNLYNEDNSLTEQLEILFKNGFTCKYVISSGKEIPSEFSARGYLPTRIFESDGFNRGEFQNVSYEDAIYFATAMPKLARYIFLERA